ncbi:MAG TPA: hypothetical protein VFR97_06155 [Capillimicrobium sp.]|nr:hypothetical protein [Capillimicrobium sp.]
MIRLALAAALATLAALASAVPAAAQTPSPTPSCPTFEVLHDDRIGALQVPAGPYLISVRTPETLTCAEAADLFRQFLQDFDGKLFGGWRVDAASKTFTRRGGAQSFTIARATTPTPSTPTIRPTGGGRCPGTFRVLHDDRIGALQVPAGQYTITLVATGRLSCGRAGRLFARFLQDFDGVLPGRWFVDPETGTFYRGTVNVGFRVEPVATNVAPAQTKVVPGDGRPCPGTFRVLHNDMVGALSLPAGPYTLIPLRGSNLGCAEVADLFRRFLAAAQNALPEPWRVQVSSATFTRGSSSRVGFRVEPAS